jgi:arginine-tRNA-protein transferase
MEFADYLLISSPLYLQDKCGYCHGTKSAEEATSIKSWAPYNKSFHRSKTIGFQVENMNIQQYEKLVNLNYRRSGTFLYKSDNLRNCCFYYTIRTNMEKFKISKELKNDLNKFNEFIGVGKNHDKQFNVDKELNKVLKSDQFELKFEKSSENFNKKFELFKSYQASIHDDEVTKKSFKRFLVDNPFNIDEAVIETTVDPITNEISYKVRGFGAIQLCYYYQNQLIGVSFLDVFPTGLSSIYFIYDNKLVTDSKLSMGKVSIMIELLMMQKLDLQYLYLGYYIRDCVKMKYKSKFGGEVLHPLSFKWVEFQDQTFTEINEELEQKFGHDSFKLDDELISLLRVEHFKFDTSNDFFNVDKDHSMYEIPLVVINSTSIEKILRNQNRITIKLLAHGNLIDAKFAELTDAIKEIVLNLIRLIGMDLIDDVILYV